MSNPYTIFSNALIFRYEKGEFSVPEVKLSALHAKLLNAQQVQVLSAKQLASLIGKIISMSLALCPVTQLMTHS